MPTLRSSLRLAGWVLGASAVVASASRADSPGSPKYLNSTIVHTTLTHKSDGSPMTDAGERKAAKTWSTSYVVAGGKDNDATRAAVELANTKASPAEFLATIEKAAKLAKGRGDGTVTLFLAHGGALGGGGIEEPAFNGTVELNGAGTMSLVGRETNVVSGDGVRRINIFNINYKRPKRTDGSPNATVELSSAMEEDLKFYLDIGKKLTANGVRSLVILNCDAGKASQFIQKMADDWGVLVAVPRRSVAVQVKSPTRVRVFYVDLEQSKDDPKVFTQVHPDSDLPETEENIVFNFARNWAAAWPKAWGPAGGAGPKCATIASAGDKAACLAAKPAWCKMSGGPDCDPLAMVDAHDHGSTPLPHCKRVVGDPSGKRGLADASPQAIAAKQPFCSHSCPAGTFLSDRRCKKLVCPQGRALIGEVCEACARHPTHASCHAQPVQPGPIRVTLQCSADAESRAWDLHAVNSAGSVHGKYEVKCKNKFGKDDSALATVVKRPDARPGESYQTAQSRYVSAGRFYLGWSNWDDGHPLQPRCYVQFLGYKEGTTQPDGRGAESDYINCPKATPK